MKKVGITFSLILVITLLYFSPTLLHKNKTTNELLGEFQKETTTNKEPFSNIGTIRLIWKINPNQPIGFKTSFDQLDINDFTFDLGQNEDEVSENLKQLIEQRRNEFENTSFITLMKTNNRGNIETKMFSEKYASKTSKSQNLSLDGILLRGEINNKGKTKSFYVKNDQKNLLSILFELPSKPIKLNDTWPIKVNFIEVDQSFVCDSSEKINEVKLINILKESYDTIAVLRYNLIESVEGYIYNSRDKTKKDLKMEISFKGIAEFSITQGRWNKFNGIIEHNQTGFMYSNSKQKISLVPIKTITDKMKNIE